MLRTRVPGECVDDGMRWARDDAVDRQWWPQGITSSADASGSETYAGRNLLLVSWYAKETRGVRKGSRISVIDLDTLAYRHVLLAVPSLDAHGRLRLSGLRAHAGGIVWHGPYLHVAATRKGLYTARVGDLMRVPDRFLGHDPEVIGVDGGRPATFGYAYVLPVCSTYVATCGERTEPMRYSFVSLARSSGQRMLVAGEYGRSQMSKRLVVYPIDASTHELTADRDGVARPRQVQHAGIDSMQGATVVDDRWYITRSRGRRGMGSVYVGRPGDLEERRRALPFGPEDVTYWPSSDRLFSVAEWPGRRWVFSMRRSRVDQ